MKFFFILSVGLIVGFLVGKFSSQRHPLPEFVSQSLISDKVEDTAAYKSLIRETATVPPKQIPIKKRPKNSIEQDIHVNESTFVKIEDSPEVSTSDASKISADPILNLSEIFLTDFLKWKQLDLTAELSQTKTFSTIPDYLPQMTGKFQGRVNFKDKDAGEIIVELNPEKILLDDGTLKGKSHIQIKMNDDFNISSRNEIHLAMRQTSDSAKGLLLYALPSFFLQVFVSDDGTALVGNLYKKSKFENSSSLVGIFFLNRVY